MKQIKKNKKKFEYLLSKISKKNDLSENFIIANYALLYAVKQNVGYWASNRLETFFCECAEKIEADVSNIKYEKNTVLHVATTTCNIGGHSRVIERWIEQASDTQKHSVVLLNQICEIPQKIKDNVSQKNGQLYIFDTSANTFEKAKKLRQLAMQYEYIVLHIHMEDPTAVIAFGTQDFTRPVIFFNHADHLFWIGKSIADKIVDFRTIQSITPKRRGINAPFILPIPSDKLADKYSDKNKAREKLNLPVDKKIILTIGSDFKFNPINNKNLLSPIKQIINKSQNTICLAIGPSLNNQLWKKAYEETKGNIKALGEVNYNTQYFDYINASDLIIDSWPMNGGTVIKDAISCSKPVLSLKSPIGQCDYVLKSTSYCETETELVEKACEILSNENKAKEYFNNIKQKFFIETDSDIWKQHLDALIKSLPEQHTVKDLSQEPEINIIDEYSILLNQIYSFKATKIKKSKIIKSYLKYYFFKYIIKDKNKRNEYLKKFIAQYLIDSK